MDAKEQRDHMYKAIEETNRNTSDLGHRVNNVEKNLTKINPVVDRVKGWQSMALGGLLVLGVIGTVITFVWEAVRDKLVSVFTGG
jgi:hypothetical protein